MSELDSWNNLTTVLEQAQLARGAQDETRALTLYVRATQIDPDNANAWAGRAAMALDPDDAIIAWSYTLALTPQDDNARAILAQRIQERLEASGRGDLEDLVALGRDVAKAGQKSGAHKIFVRVTELAANNADAWVWHAGSTDRLEEQVSDLIHALELEPQNPHARTGLHMLLEGEIAVSQFASPQMVEQAAYELGEGQRLLASGDQAGALAMIAHASELNPWNETAWLWRASATRDVNQSLLCLELALVLNPKNPAALQAREFLRQRKLELGPAVIAAATEPVAPTHVPEPVPNHRAHTLVIVIAAVILILLLFAYLRTTSIIH